MTEPESIEFHERVEPTGSADGPGGTSSRSVLVRAGIVAGSALLVVIGAVAAMGASPAPSTSNTDPSATPTPTVDRAPNGPFNGMLRQMVGPMGLDFGTDLRGGPGIRLGGFGDITITAIDGSNLSLKTDDGWTRTISVGGSTKITRGGQTIAVGDLKVGDQIVFGETRATDGTYSIDAIRVVLPTVGGQVTAVGADSITIDQKGGGSATIHVDSNTTYAVNGNQSAKLSDVTVGSFVIAEGTKRGDGSLDAARVQAIDARTKGGAPDGNGMPDFKFRFGPDGPDGNPRATPTPTPASGTSSSTS